MTSTVAVNRKTANVRAIVTTRWGASGYRPRVIRDRIESFYLDTSLDNDADPWQLVLGSAEGEFLSALNRDSEVRVQIFGVGANVSGLPAFTGIADDISLDENSALTLSGRDLSALAIDSTPIPQKFQHIQAYRLVDQQAREIGFSKTDLARSFKGAQIIKKLQYTDGSESYWEFWHRIYRKEQMWLWTEPDGTLVADTLKYSGTADYYFGTPRSIDGANIRRSYIPVEALAVRKSTQARIYEVWVFGHKGDNGFHIVAHDPQLASWIKRPRKVMLDTEAHNQKAAEKTAWEEIFESKVGAMEYTLTITDPGYEIKQNTIAIVNLPDPGITGEFFVVGTRRQVGLDGFVQEIRLRERNYAISRRVPQDPKIAQTQKPGDAGGVNTAEEFPNTLSGVGSFPQEWSAYFMKAANEFYGPWDYNLFLATLIGIADVETGGSFQNERENGGPGGDHQDWYMWSPGNSSEPRHMVDEHGRTKAQWQELFANEPGAYVSRQYGVGPMQLTDPGVKLWADGHYKTGSHDEYAGGRWRPEHNIWAGAKLLRQLLKEISADSGRTEDMWLPVSAYNHGAGGAKLGDKYSSMVKTRVMTTPGYLALVKQARKQASADSKTQGSTGFKTDPGDSRNPNTGFENSPSQIAGLTNLKRANKTVDLVHTNYELLRRANSMFSRLGVVAVIQSAHRDTGKHGDPPGAGSNGGDTQWYLYDRYVASGRLLKYIAGHPYDPATGHYGSWHEHGEAIDVYVNGIAVSKFVSAATMAIYGLHCSVAGDDPHMTRIQVTG